MKLQRKHAGAWRISLVGSKLNGLAVEFFNFPLRLQGQSAPTYTIGVGSDFI